MKVVIVDDFETNALIVKAYMQELTSVEPLVFTESRKALEFCLTSEPDMVLVDYVMPEIDGLEFIRQMRARPDLDEVPIVMITAFDRREVLLQALDLGANDFLGKPLDELELKARTRNMLKLRARSVALADANRALHKLATTDVLTDLMNRRSFMERANAEVARARRYRKPLSVLLIDADHFKRINDTYGHSGGDAVLRELANHARHIVREMDFAGRLGGEEFAICLPETPLDGAMIVAERLRERVATMPVAFDGQDIRVTISTGVADIAGGDGEVAPLLQRADVALYEAKNGGRNRVIAARQEG
ncbi:MAG: diguanylate cyclase [Alphaproteobacteria bacterium]|nr:diguanylate cyclase [Alphaproteobacteria bacterium]TAD90691.1 MAG: diguanylate cyclase [Alphaproteobacteria bacterium]